MGDSTPWCILTKRYGVDVRNPTELDLEAAANELFHEELPGMTVNDYEEHGAACLRYGFDDGPLFVIEGNRTGRATLSKYADQDFEDILGEITVLNVAEAGLFQLWKWLAAGDIAAIRRAYPDCAW